jgi:drug/metabolite transporter (DMT)-like permease
MLTTYLGEITALLASICFAIGPTMNTLAGRQVSIYTVNRVRLLLTLLILVTAHWLITGNLFPGEMTLERWFWLGLSAMFSLVIGDTLLFEAFSLIGTRLSMLVVSLVPVFSALLAFAFLDERLRVVQIAGILVTISGVIWVLFDRKNGGNRSAQDKKYLRGFLLALGSALLHALGVIAAKKGLAGDFPALSGHVIRMLVALTVVWGAMLVSGHARQTVDELRARPISLRYILLGAVFGPFLGMWLSLVAIQYTQVGIATALTSLPPIWLLPIGYYFFRERIGPRAISGSVIAVIGVAMIFLL